MNSQIQRAASACPSLLATLLVAALPSAYAQIPMRGFQGNLDNTADTFLSLDLNGDGKADLLYSRPGGGYAGAYLSHGDGTFHYIPYVSGGTSSNGFNGDLSSSADRFIPLDLNGDGKDDLILYRPGGGYTLRCLSKGDGSLNCDYLTSSGTDHFGFGDSMTNGNTRIVAMKRRGSPAEFLVYTPGGGSAGIYVPQAGSNNLQNINLASNSRATTSTGWQDNMTFGDEQIVSLDANGDGFPDLLAYSPQAGSVRLYLNNGNNAFTMSPLGAPGRNSNGFTGNSQDSQAHLIALDLNGDSKQDFLWWQAGSKTVIGFLSNGNGTVTAVNYLTNGTPANGFQDTDSSTGDNAVALDLNGDGKSDFIWYSPGNNIVTAYTSSTSGALTATTYRDGVGNAGNNFASSSSTQYEHALPLNFMGTNASGFVWYVPGSGTFQAYTPQATGTLLNYYKFFASPSDFMRDLAWSIADLPLKEVVIPGAHDSSMYLPLNGGQDAIITNQWDDMPYQLTNGARYLDFRVTYVRNGPNGLIDAGGKGYHLATTAPSIVDTFYMFGHADYLTNRPTVDIVNQVEDWLTQHPDEVVFLDLSGYSFVSFDENGQIDGDNSKQFGQLLTTTHHPELIYTQQVACGSAHCTNPAVQPQNMSINQLKQQAKARLILVQGPNVFSDLGWSWTGIHAEDVGYCDDEPASGLGGRATAAAEITCINSPNLGNSNPKMNSSSQSIHTARPDYEAAAAATQFMQFQAQLTPYGGTDGAAPVAIGPLLLADGSGGDYYGFNNGGDADDFNNQLINGSWSVNALNIVTFDAVGHDNLPTLLIQRNHQKWADTHFFNNNFAQPAGALSIGANGDIWASGTGHAISVFKYVNGAWKALINSQPNVRKLAVDPQGGVWVVDNTYGAGSFYGRLLHYDANGQNKTDSGSVVQDVAVGKNGSVWAIGIDFSIFQLSGPTDGSADISGSVPTLHGTHVAVDNMGHPWIVDNNGNIQKFNGSSWQQVSSAQGNEIVAGADGSIFVTGRNTPSIGRYNTQNNNFDFLQMDAAHIAVDGGGQPWAIRQGTGSVYKGALDQM